MGDSTGPATASQPALGVLVSGAGTILGAMVDAGLQVRCVLADRPCAGVQLAQKRGIDAAVVERRSFGRTFDRDAFSSQVANELAQRGVQVVAMAGFGTVLGAPMFARYADRVLNTHPSLLPAFPGWRAVADALAYGAKVTGCTVHIATETVDHGPVLAQETVPVHADDTVETLHERIKTVERRLYPATIARFLAELGDGVVEGAGGSESAQPSQRVAVNT